MDDASLREDDELAVTIANIVICFNTVTDLVEHEHLAKWLTDFAERFVHAASCPDSNINLKWYLEKYISLCELLVSKYPSVVSRKMTEDMLQIFGAQTTANFTRAVWFKLLKLLAGLKQLPALLQSTQYAGLREQLMQFAIKTYRATAEPLCFIYFIRANSVLLQNCDVETMYQTSINFKQVLAISDEFSRRHSLLTDDLAALDGIACYFNLLKFLLGFPLMHKHIQANTHIGLAFEMMRTQKNPEVVRCLADFLIEAARSAGFYASLLGEA